MRSKGPSTKQSPSTRQRFGVIVATSPRSTIDAWRKGLRSHKKPSATSPSASGSTRVAQMHFLLARELIEGSGRLTKKLVIGERSFGANLTAMTHSPNVARLVG